MGTAIEKRLAEAEQRAAALPVHNLTAGWDLTKLSSDELRILRGLAVKAGAGGDRHPEFDWEQFAAEFRAYASGLIAAGIDLTRLSDGQVLVFERLYRLAARRTVAGDDTTGIVGIVRDLDADAFASDIAGCHGDVGHCHNHGRALAMLGDSKAIVDCRIAACSIEAGGSAHRFSRNAGDRLQRFG